MQAAITDILPFFGLVGLPATIAAGVTLYVVHLARDTITEKIRAAIKAEYDERLETLKARLKAESDLELERSKHALALEANRQSLRFARLHDKRASVIADVYAALSDTFYALRAYTAAFETAGGPSQQERLDTLAEKHRQLRQAFYPKQIFFPPEVAQRLERIEREIFAVGNVFMWTVQNQPQGAYQTTAWMEVLKRIEGPINEALRGLEAEFRKLLGDE